MLDDSKFKANWQSQNIAFLGLLLASFLFVVNNAFVKVLDDSLAPEVIVYTRMGVATLFSLLIFRGKINFGKIFGASFKQKLFLLFLGVFPSGVAVFLRTVALSLTSLLNVQIVHGVLPAVTYIYSLFFFKKKFDWRVMGLILLATYGVAVVASNNWLPVISAFGWGETLVLMAVFITALGYIFRKDLTKNFNTFEISIVGFGLSTLIFVVVSAFNGTLLDFGNLDLWSWVFMILHGITSALPILIMNHILLHLSPELASQESQLKAVFALIIGYIFFDEIPAVVSIVGGMVVFASIYYSKVVQGKEKKAK